MKKLLFAFTFLSFLLVNTSFGQDLTSQSNSLIAFNVTVMPDVYNKLDTYEPSTTREKATMKKSKNVLSQYIMDHLYTQLMDQLKSEKNITINDKDAMVDGRVIYNEFGYPFPLSAKGAIKKARKNGVESDAYLKVSISIGGSLDVLGGAKLSKQVKAEMNMTVAFLGPDGKEISKAKSKLKSKEQIKAKNFPGKKFDKMDTGYMKLLFEALQADLDNLVETAVGKL